MKGLLAAAGAALLALIAHFMGIDLTGGPTGAGSGGGAATQDPVGADPGPGDAAAEPRDDTDEIQRLFRAMRSGVHVEAEGVVVHILPDDTDGDQHQLFLLDLRNDLTLKIAHNIDIAPRVPLEKGDTVRFRGDYEYNEKGGVVHWTHRNTRGGSHPHGWLEHEGNRYE